MFQFAEPVYRVLGDCYLPPDPLVVEVSCTALDPNTFAPERFSYGLAVPGGEGPERVLLRPDVQEIVIGVYDESHNLSGVRRVDFHARAAADYYVQAEIKKLVPASARTNEGGMLVPVPPSGVVRQMTWQMTRGGVRTVASANTEHGRHVPPYPARRWREALSPDPFQAARSANTGLRPAANALARAVRRGRRRAVARDRVTKERP